MYKRKSLEELSSKYKTPEEKFKNSNQEQAVAYWELKPKVTRLEAANTKLTKYLTRLSAEHSKLASVHEG